MTSRASSIATQRAMRLSLAAGFVMLVLKVGAYLVTGSAAILGDAAESVVHLVAVGFAAFSLSLASRPADHNHPYGHSKIAFISAGVEGGLIIVAAVYIVYESLRHFLSGLHVSHIDKGLALTITTIIINAALGLYLVRTGRRYRSLILKANGKHVLTDGWTSLGAVAGLLLTHLTGFFWWDPLFGLIIAANILVSGWSLIRESVNGLMDEADPALDVELAAALERETAHRGLSFHALRHRNAGEVHYVDVHLLFPDDILLKQAHRLATEIEMAVAAGIARPLHITTHLETAGDHDEIHPDEPVA